MQQNKFLIFDSSPLALLSASLTAQIADVDISVFSFHLGGGYGWNLDTTDPWGSDVLLNSFSLLQDRQQIMSVSMG